MKKIFLFIVGICLAVAVNVYAQQASAARKPFTKADSAAINALVLYPDTIRLHIFEACLNPELIVRIANEQKNTSTDFAAFISKYSKKKHEDYE